MTTNPDLTNGKTISELDAIIAAATQRKADLFDAELEGLIRDIERRCDVLGITPKEVFALWNKHRRKARAHKDNGATEE